MIYKSVNSGYTWCSTLKMMALLTHRAQSGFEQGLVEVMALKDSSVLRHQLSLTLQLFNSPHISWPSSLLSPNPPLCLLPSFITLLLTSSHFLLPPPSLPQRVMLWQRGPGMMALPGHHITAALSCSKPHQQPQLYRNSFRPQLTCREDYMLSPQGCTV